MEKNSFTLQEAHAHFAKTLNGRVWELLGKPDRSRIENDEMLHAAFACIFHWKFAGGAVNQQRGEWLVSRVYAVLGNATEALRHAERCFEWTEAYRIEMKDFDIAYAYEGLARAHGLAGNLDKEREYFELANKAGEVIANEEDKSIFMGDLNYGEWPGLR